MINFGPSLIFIQWLRIEVIISAIISAIIWDPSVASRHEAEMTDAKLWIASLIFTSAITEDASI
jgi:hypothetical protein